MTESFLMRQLTWRRHGTGWRLLAGRRRFGEVVPDSKYPNMWRSPKSDGRMSDMANLSWAKNAVLEEALREPGMGGPPATCNHPLKTPANSTCFRVQIATHAFFGVEGVYIAPTPSANPGPISESRCVCCFEFA